MYILINRREIGIYSPPVLHQNGAERQRTELVQIRVWVGLVHQPGDALPHLMLLPQEL